ncbi:MAG: acylneuraminate cytidylyltransferase family protein [Verrucomicrobiota bacterium]|nr:acylneuraminate cytidylyltransferase family protein [Verrucomicrobiota bacterium]
MSAAHPEIIGLIPARAGSKRVPGKNVRPLHGHPLIAYTISAAIDSGVFSRVIVSTDSEEIAALCQHYGAETPFLRPAEFAGDKSPDIEWIQHALITLKKMGSSAEAFSILRPTSPFRLPATIQRAWKQFQEITADSLRAVELCRQHPGKMWIIEGSLMKPLLDDGGTNPPWHSTPYQALPTVYTQNASLEMAWSRVPLEEGTIAGRKIIPFLTEGFEGFDINKADDWWLAETILDRKLADLPIVRRPARFFTQP